MATPKDFIGIDNLNEVAKQVFKNVVIGPAYADPAEMQRLGIKTISGIQFKRLTHLAIRKGGQTRRKDVNKSISNTALFLKERELTAKLAWWKGTDNIDKYCETVFGTDAQGAYPLSTEAVEAVIKDYADDLFANLWFGDIDNEKSGATDEQKALALYDGFHTVIKHDVEDGIINEMNGNLVPCGAITAPANAHDTSAYDTFVEWYMKWDARLRRVNTLVYMTSATATYIAQAYANKYHGNFKVNYTIGGSYTIPEMPKVTITPVEGFGVGDRMIATIPNNFVYAVDSEGNQTYCDVRLGTDNDHRDIDFQIQSIQGAGIENPLKHAFCMSDGSIATEEFMAGDVTTAKLVVTVDQPEDGTAKVQVNGEDYPKAQEFAPNTVVTLTAVKGNKTFKGWSNGKTDETITLTTAGMPIGLTAFFE